jgi:hypothetical protein
MKDLTLPFHTIPAALVGCMEDTVERTVVGLARTPQAAFAMKVHPRMGLSDDRCGHGPAILGIPGKYRRGTWGKRGVHGGRRGKQIVSLSRRGLEG